MLEDLNVLILNYILFFSCDRSLVLWHNGVKLTASWEPTFAPPLTLTVLQSSMLLSFLERLLNANQGGTVRSTNYFLSVTFSAMELLLH